MLCTNASVHCICITSILMVNISDTNNIVFWRCMIKFVTFLFFLKFSCKHKYICELCSLDYFGAIMLSFHDQFVVSLQLIKVVIRYWHMIVVLLLFIELVVYTFPSFLMTCRELHAIFWSTLKWLSSQYILMNFTIWFVPLPFFLSSICPFDFFSALLLSSSYIY